VQTVYQKVVIDNLCDGRAWFYRHLYTSRRSLAADRNKSIDFQSLS